MIVVSVPFLILSLLGGVGFAAENITASTSLLANQTLLSPRQIFELGFFTPNGSTSLYLGIWYNKPGPLRVVWVANRETPIAASQRSGTSLGIGADGNLRLIDGVGKMVWSTNVSASNPTVASISDDGNFILLDGSSNELWGSFGDLTDTIVPGMGMRVNQTGLKHYMTSWRSESDPARGAFKTGMTLETPPQTFTWKGTKPYWRGGQWDKSVFIGIPTMSRNYLNTITIEQDINKGTLSFFYQPSNNSFPELLYISPTGVVMTVYWDEETITWVTDWEAPKNPCEIYGTCGNFGVCNTLNSPICGCMEGFMPSSADEWNRGNWSNGCVRQKELNCQKSMNASASDKVKTDDFLHLSYVKLPDTASFQAEIEDEGECRAWCLSNCSCLAYSYVNSIGCLAWRGYLLDIQDFGSNYGEDLYVRVTSIGRSTLPKALIISLTSSFVVILVGAVMLLWWNVRSNQRGRSRKISALLDVDDRLDDQQGVWKGELRPEDAAELPFYSFDSIVQATNNFDISNKLGQGGFGFVYKGKLNDGREVAVKRLASSSSQGIVEFSNEVILISKLLHRNLVRLIGWCIEREEKILVYEYLPNKSLDTILFDAERKSELCWSKRFSIIQGVARGLLYLHKDSTLRVIHRDLKVSNILLDDKMNPKISDFGLARMFEGTRDLINTGRVVGTLGYMSPEYAMAGMVSEKSDIYSFGVLLLEIVSGKKNTNISLLEDRVGLLSYVWKLWSDGRVMDLVDDELGEFSTVEVTRCIQVGLLCVQDQAIDRPNMTAVVLMLSGESEFPQPKQPLFMFRSMPSSNFVSITTLDIWIHDERRHCNSEDCLCCRAFEPWYRRFLD